MTSPPRRIDTNCAACERPFHDWYRPSINFGLGERWSRDAIIQATTIRCSHCGLLHHSWNDMPAAGPRRRTPSRTAVLSHDRRYRYALWRTWAPHAPAVLFIGLNPSVADAARDDPTIRRCIAFAKSWGYGGVAMANLFAWRATDPSELKTAEDPVGDDNTFWLLKLAQDIPTVVAAWGNNGRLQQRAAEVRELLAPWCRLQALRVPAKGEPAHPLYLPKDLRPMALESMRP